MAASTESAPVQSFPILKGSPVSYQKKDLHFILHTNEKLEVSSVR